MKKDINGVDRIAKMMDCDAVFVEDNGGEMVAVSPYNLKTGVHYFGMTLLTCYDEVFAAKVKKVTSDNPHDLANKKMQEHYAGSGAKPQQKKKAKKKSTPSH